jgi:hypothetical protein
MATTRQDGVVGATPFDFSAEVENCAGAPFRATSASVELGFSYGNSWATKEVVGLKSLERRDDWMDFAGDRSNATDSGT